MKRMGFIGNLTWVFALLLAAVQEVCAQSPLLPYREGESLTYVVNYKWGTVNTDVGEAVTDLSYEDGLFHAVITGRTFRFYDMFFKVREHFESRFHADPFLPSYFYRNTQEGKYRMKNRMHFDNDAETIDVRTQKYDRTPKDTVIANRENRTYDMPSLFYKIRSFDFDTLRPGVKNPISFIIDDDVYNFHYTLVGKEVKKIKGLGTFNTLKFAVRLVAGSVFTGEEEMSVWITDDGNKIPLLFESPIIVGKVQGRLVRYRNLKGPLESKIK